LFSCASRLVQFHRFPCQHHRRAVPFRPAAIPGGAPGELVKIGTGAWIACLATLLLVVGCALTNRVPLFAPVFYDVLLGVAFLYYWPTVLALVSRAAPPLAGHDYRHRVPELFHSNTPVAGLARSSSG
jgi:hypothetical protein